LIAFPFPFPSLLPFPLAFPSVANYRRFVFLWLSKAKEEGSVPLCGERQKNGLAKLRLLS